ncbi:helix-turn-helix domain-containing protein [Paratractidigestivibacter sp.]|uniref:helix-turn-helix domain-containing protein n=1 Tax=Paratractidigestivibacter sp. TaxID=2847316 RepID=UPI002AC95CA4|nr:helix-turn-helix domain-containing protein [Paratractidigestivibacter sp.]
MFDTNGDTGAVDLEHAPALLTVKQTCATLNVSRNTVYNMIGSGKLERVKFGRAARIRTDSVARLLAQ